MSAEPRRRRPCDGRVRCQGRRKSVGLAVVSIEGIARLYYQGKTGTYVHVELLPIASLAAHNGRHHDELVVADEVAYTSLVLAVGGGYVEFQGSRENHEQKK